MQAPLILLFCLIGSFSSTSAAADPLLPQLPSISLPQATPPMELPKPANPVGSVVDTSKAKPLPHEGLTIQPALPKNIIPLSVKQAPTPPQLPKFVLPELPKLPTLPTLPNKPKTDSEAALPLLPDAGESAQELRDQYDARVYQEKELRAARIARRLKTSHRNSKQPPAFLVAPKDTENAHLPSYLMQEQLVQELFKTIDDNDLTALRSLLERTRDVNATNPTNKETLLIHATKLGKVDVVHLLLWLRASLDLADADGHTALHYAVRNKNKDLVRLLVANGADINAEDKNNLSPFIVGLHSLQEDEMHNLQMFRHASKSSLNKSLIQAVRLRDSKKLELLLRNGANPNAKDRRGQTAMSIAEDSKFVEIVNILREYGGKPTQPVVQPIILRQPAGTETAPIQHTPSKPYSLFDAE